MKHLILAALFFASQLAWAANAPVMGKSASDTDFKDVRRIQLPLLQMSDFGKGAFLFETGNHNIVYDPGFEVGEDNATHAGFTCTTDTATYQNSGDSGFVLEGGRHLRIAGSSGSTGNCISQQYTYPASMSLQNGQIEYDVFFFSANVRTVTLEVFNSSNQVIGTTTYKSNVAGGNFQTVKISTNFVFPQKYDTSGSALNPYVYYKISHDAQSGTYRHNMDNLYIGPAKNVYTGSVEIPWTDYSPGFTTASGTPPGVTVNEAMWMRDGENLYLRGRVTLTSAGSGWATPCINFPAGASVSQAGPLTYIGEATLGDTSGNNYRAGTFRGSPNQLCFAQYVGAALEAYTTITTTNPFSWVSPDTIGWEAGPIRIQEWVGTGQTALGLNTPLWKTNTLAVSVSNTGAVTSENVDWINGNCSLASTNQFTCSFNSGMFSVNPICTVSPAASVSSNMSDQLVTISTSSFRVDTFSANAANAHAFNVHCERVGSDRVSVDMPLVTQSVVQPDAMPLRIVRVRSNGGCSSSPCSLSINSGATSVTQTTGNYTLNFAVPFSSPPTCTNSVGGNAAMIGVNNAASTTSFLLQTFVAGAPTNASFEIICFGPI